MLFIEYQGKIHTFSQPATMGEVWFMAKHSRHPAVESLAKMWQAHRLYGCEYEAEIMKLIKTTSFGR